MNKKVELLAPAKNKTCAFAAIDSGADAIYIGASEFGARKNVPNSLEDIKEIVDYAHKFDVKVYIALNTILTDSEIERAEKLIAKLEKIGIDALIIQDFGLIEIAQRYKIPIHASTQCDNRTVEKVKMLEDIGFTRVVLARELSLEEIEAIKKQTKTELECFIHGALCVSYSGQCYLSYLLGGRSANRGECAQPCRKKYSLVSQNGEVIAQNEHLLCLKDFNAEKHIKKMAEIGVTSFKIEGRLKDENYVKNTVSYYRKLIDKLGLGKTSSGIISTDFEPKLEKSFNRGFTDYFLSGKRSEIFSFKTPKAIGEFIGDVKTITNDYLELSNKTDLHPQDGICFDAGKEYSGFLINKIDGTKIFPNKMPKELKKGDKLYRNTDSEFEFKLKNSKTTRKIPVKIIFKDKLIQALDGQNRICEIQYNYEETAQNQEKMKSNIITQFKKSGNSMFEVNDIETDNFKLPFLPVSALNSLRRDLLDKMESERLKSYIPQRIEYNQTSKNLNFGQITDFRLNVLNKKAKQFYEKIGIQINALALESKNQPNSKICAMQTKHCLKYAFGLCKSTKKLFLVDEKGKKFELQFDCEKCEMKIIF